MQTLLLEHGCGSLPIHSGRSELGKPKAFAFIDGPAVPCRPADAPQDYARALEEVKRLLKGYPHGDQS